MNKKNKYVVLLIFLVSVIYIISFVKKFKSSDTLYQANQEPDNVFHTEESQPENELLFQRILPDLEDLKLTNEAIQYQMDFIGNFTMFLDSSYSYSMENEDYRNVDISLYLDEEGHIMQKYYSDLYVMDTVIDKYIRDYGGKEVPYHIIDRSMDKENYLLTAGNGDDILTIIYNGYSRAASVRINNMNDAAVNQAEEMAAYLKYEENYDSYINKILEEELWDNKFALVINKAEAQDIISYRNISTEGVEDKEGIRLPEYAEGFYIADIAIDRYIRDYKGRDVLYQAEIMEYSENSLRKINVVNGEERLAITYSEDSWFVAVEIGGHN